MRGIREKDIETVALALFLHAGRRTGRHDAWGRWFRIHDSPSSEQSVLVQLPRTGSPIQSKCQHLMCCSCKGCMGYGEAVHGVLVQVRTLVERRLRFVHTLLTRDCRHYRNASFRKQLSHKHRQVSYEYANVVAPEERFRLGPSGPPHPTNPPIGSF